MCGAPWGRVVRACEGIWELWAPWVHWVRVGASLRAGGCEGVGAGVGGTEGVAGGEGAHGPGRPGCRGVAEIGLHDEAVVGVGARGEVVMGTGRWRFLMCLWAQVACLGVVVVGMRGRAGAWPVGCAGGSVCLCRW